MSATATAETPKTTTDFEQKLDRLAQVAIRSGLGLAEGQELVMTASTDALPLARKITEHAYRAGASLVTLLFSDEESALLRYQYGQDKSFDAAAVWLYEGMAAAYKSGAARLAITGGNPSLLSQQDPEKVSRANRSMSKAYRPALELITRHEINWTIVPAATPAWAAAVFPELEADEALRKLWDAIFAASRADQSDPVAAWKKHDDKLHMWAARNAHGPVSPLAMYWKIILGVMCRNALKMMFSPMSRVPAIRPMRNTAPAALTPALALNVVVAMTGCYRSTAGSAMTTHPAAALTAPAAPRSLQIPPRVPRNPEVSPQVQQIERTDHPVHHHYIHRAFVCHQQHNPVKV